MPQESWGSALDSLPTQGIQGANTATFFTKALMRAVGAGRRRQKEQKLKPVLRQG